MMLDAAQVATMHYRMVRETVRNTTVWRFPRQRQTKKTS